MKQSVQRGFTLIELVVVITILGILAAFAVPRFMSMDQQARIGALNGMQGTVRSASTLAHGAWLATGNAPANIVVDGVNVTMTFGYPAATAAGIGNSILDRTGFNVAYAGGVATFSKIGAPNVATCGFTFTTAVNANTPPVIGALSTAGC